MILVALGKAAISSLLLATSTAADSIPSACAALSPLNRLAAAVIVLRMTSNIVTPSSLKAARSLAAHEGPSCKNVRIDCEFLLHEYFHSFALLIQELFEVTSDNILRSFSVYPIATNAGSASVWSSRG